MKRNTLTWQATTLAAAISAATAGQAIASPDFDIRGRAHFDVGFYDADETQLDDDAILRRARIGVNGQINEYWDGRIEYDFSEEDVSAADVRLRRSLPMGRLIIGQTKVPIGLNQLTSSNTMTFIERSSVSNVIPDARRLGLGYEMSEGPVTFQSRIYTRALGDDKEDGNAQLGGALRTVFNPIHQGGEMLHLGFSVAYEDRGDQKGVRFADRPESRPDGKRLIDTNENSAIEDADSTLKYGLELAYQNGPFSAEAEYLSVDVDRRNSSDPTFDGYHVQGSYVLTGESRSYSSGAFGGITPSSASGAWEVAARFSQMDLEDSGVTGGEQQSITLGLNHYVTSNLRFMANLIRTDVDNGPLADGEDETFNTALFRAAYHF